MLRRSALPGSRAAVAAVAGALVLALTSCGSTPAPTVSPDADKSPIPTASATPTPAAYDPDGTAEANLPVFRSVATSVWATDKRGSGRAYVDALIAAGFDRAAMQVTNDTSTVGNPAETMMFSVRWGAEECLIGQVGPSTGGVVTTVMPQLAEGRCLVGTTRAIDW